MIDIEWADPPTPKGGALTRREQSDFAEKLKEHRGRWAILPAAGESNLAIRALTSRINCGRQSAFGEGFEAVSRDGVVYVRFVG
jgi:hypothetical protein